MVLGNIHWTSIGFAALAGATLVAVGIVGFTRFVADRGELLVALVARSDIEGMEHVAFTITSIEGWSEEEGWMRLSTRALRVEGAQLSGDGVLALRKRIEADTTLARMRLSISDVRLPNERGASASASPLSNTIVFPVTLRVGADTSNAVIIDMQLSESRYNTEDGALLFVPSLAVETRENVAHTDAQGKGLVGGVVTTQATFGMNAAGMLQQNYRLPKTTVFRVEDGVITVVMQSPTTPVIHAEEILREQNPTENATTPEIRPPSSESIETFSVPSHVSIVE